MFETLKIVLPSRRELDFYKMAFFEFDGKSIKESPKNQWIFRSKIKKNRLKNAFENHCFFFIDFSWIFHGFWPCFGGSWEGFGHHLAVQKGPRKNKIRIFSKIAIFYGFGEGLGRVLGGFGDGFGKVLGGSGSFVGTPGPQLEFTGLC